MSDKKSENYNLQRNLDNIIRSRMKGESSLSSLNYSPHYQNDSLSRLILHGNNSITAQPLKYNLAFKQKEPNRYFPNVQHQYLNYEKMWNLPDQNKNTFSTKEPIQDKIYNDTRDISSYSKYSIDNK